MTEESRNPLEVISEITEFNELHNFMNDAQLDKCMELVVRLLMKPDVPAAMAPRLIVELQALSTKFSMLAVYYATIARDRAGSENNNRKNIYYSVKEALDKLVDALKYSARYNSLS